MKKILVIRFSSIGDIVLTSPVIRCIKEQIPGVELHFLTKEEYYPVMAANPYIDKFFLLKKGLAKIVTQLKAENYDYVVDLHNSIRSNSVILSLVRPFNSVIKLNVNKWLLVKLKFNFMPDTHIVDRYFNTVHGIHVHNDFKGLDFFIDPKDEVDISQLPETHRNGYIGFAIGAKHNTKKLPVNKIISICNKINKPIVIMGGKEDRKEGEEIVSNTTNVFNACGIYNINQSASLIRQANMVITHDTGLMHIAAAFKKEIISVWGNTVPHFGMYPYLPKGEYEKSHIIEVQGLHCRPCHKLGYDVCPKGHFKCMNDINEDAIAQIANK